MYVDHEIGIRIIRGEGESAKEGGGRIGEGSIIHMK